MPPRALAATQRKSPDRFRHPSLSLSQAGRSPPGGPRGHTKPDRSRDLAQGRTEARAATEPAHSVVHRPHRSAFLMNTELIYFLMYSVPVEVGGKPAPADQDRTSRLGNDKTF